MNLKRAFERFASHRLRRWDRDTKTWVDTDVRGALQVYDRFVSDRDFGQKKRIFLVPGKFQLDLNQVLIQIPDVPGIWLVEGSNADADISDVYASAVVLREARYHVKLLRMSGGKKRASGVGLVGGTETEYHETWGDFSRYSSSESRELSAVDYTIGSWYLPKGTPVDLDTIIEDQLGQRFLVREVTTFLDLLMVRAQEQEDTKP